MQSELSESSILMQYSALTIIHPLHCPQKWLGAFYVCIAFYSTYLKEKRNMVKKKIYQYIDGHCKKEPI